MSLFSFFRKNKQETAAEDSAFYSRAESDSQTVRPRKRKSTVRSGDGEGNAPVDPVLPEKKRARRRLVGAVALVLAVVIGLPMVLDSEPKLLADDISIEIPSKDKPAPPASARQPAAEPAGATAQGGSRVPAAAALDQKEEMIEPAAVAPTPAVPGKAAGSGSQAQPKSHAAAAAKPADKPGDKATESVGKPDAAEAKHGKFTVQVAAFASMEKVNELRGRLKTAGIASYTQKVETESGERIRIRVGPLNSRQDADKMRARLTELGLNGTLVPAPS